MTAILQIGLEVTLVSKEQFEREKNYRIAISIAKGMLDKGVIDQDDFSVIDNMLSEKYCPVLRELYR
jgi:hypothetical protein